MLETVRDGFAHLRRLSDPGVNRALLAALAARGPEADKPLVRANLARRAGDLSIARAAFCDLLGSSPAIESSMAHWTVVPPGLWSDGGYAVTPLVVVDDLLPGDRMRALHEHACAREAEFHPALSTNADADPSYDPERRQTLLDWRFTQEREFFLGFIEDNLDALQLSLGLEPFAVERTEIKLSNHLDGGFFKAHADNHATYGDAGRAITWLYYFAADDAAFEGGDLLLLDSRPRELSNSPAWLTRVIPRPNRFVAFPSWFNHAVTPLTLRANSDFRNGRFAVSGHVRKVEGGHAAWWETI